MGDILFQLKKLIGVLVTPLPISLVFIILGTFFLWRLKKVKGIIFSTIGIFILTLTSLPIISTHIVRPFEFSYPKLDTTKLNSSPPSFIIVLGCWHSSDPLLPLAAKLHQCSLVRTVQAVQFWYQFPNSKVIFSGWEGKENRKSHPQVNADVAISLGLPIENIILTSGHADTEDEANAIKHIVKDKQAILITSASHIPRAIKLFNQQGIFPHPSPAEYVSGHGDFSYQLLIPKANALYQSERGIYEILGNTWIKLKTIFQ
ncbi:YdcF family protein [Catenovulum sp. SM1970]|uniref:ElyC/SanA/YdcF family protein n=1 Tax=Marinifaba aquimaris TaxID=2741323 RepID=UPI0015733735|nr:ElyC/SanA/YdcF family protein [Marinifaba aquimaris]NTS77741.1 YdcF family protein [Marinifaba aquimaris]